MNPTDFLKDWIVPLVTNNLPAIAMGLAAIAGLAMLLGLLKKLLAATLTASLNAGDWLAHKLAEKPKAVAFGLGVFALAITGLWAWHTFTAAKIIEKPVIQTVTLPDEAAIAAAAEARGKYGEAESARADADAKAKTLETRLADAEQARKQAETQAAEVTQRLHELSPPEGDETALERLKAQIDRVHANVVATQLESLAEIDAAAARAASELKPDVFMGTDRYGREVWRQVESRNPPKANYRNFRSYMHKIYFPFDKSVSTSEYFYHLSCSACDHNCRIRQKMDEIYPRLAAAKKQREADEVARKKAERAARLAEIDRKEAEENKRQADEEGRRQAEIAEKQRQSDEEWRRRVKSEQDEADKRKAEADKRSGKQRRSGGEAEKQGTELTLTGLPVPVIPGTKQGRSTPRIPSSYMAIRTEADEAVEQANALARQTDTRHLNAVAAEINAKARAGKSVLGRYYSKTYTGMGTFCFHHSCPACAANDRLKEQLGELYRRYPEAFKNSRS